MKNVYINWIIPVVVSSLLFLAVRPTLAQIPEQQLSISDYLVDNNVIVGVETVGGTSQVYYIFQDEKVFITTGGLNSRMPDTNGEYITYVTDINGGGQIFLYHIPSNQVVQLTHSSTNLQPKVGRNGWVVWEGWVPEEDGWQVFLFNGTSVVQLTSGTLSMNPDIEGEIVAYARRDITGIWRAVLYSQKDNKHIDVTTGEGAREPMLRNGKILLSQGTQEFPLTADDLLLLDLSPLVATSSAEPEVPDAPEVVTEEQIIEELQIQEENIEENSTSSADPATTDIQE